MNFLKNHETRRILFIITFTVLLTAAVFHMDVIMNTVDVILSITYPFIVGGIIAFILNVVLRQLELKLFKNVSFQTKKGRSFKRPICLVLTIIIVLFVLFVVAFLLVPRFVEAIIAIVEQLSIFIPQAQQFFEKLLADNEDAVRFIESLNIDYEAMFRQVTNFLSRSASDLISNAFNIVSSFAGTLFSFFISFIFATYLLIQKEKLSLQLRLVMKAVLSERRQQQVERVLALSFDTFTNFVSGQGLEAVVLGTLVGSCCWIFGLSYSSVVGVIAALCSFIPMFGSMIALVVGTLIQLIVSPYQALFFLFMMVIIQQIDGNLIYPHIMGNRIGLPPMYVLIAFSVGGSLMGLFGMLLFIPITSILYDLFRDWVYERIAKKEKDSKQEIV
ncbi:AI-2E family transporter [Traorella massiliensis]|uniref:AI-2E family transporter n=1 Tax=Traorella massiliensis TaxID=1903263 RepID=UPI0008F96D0C|nr:AI-2E family transporter [Traorella massiliensis]